MKTHIPIIHYAVVVGQDAPYLCALLTLKVPRLPWGLAAVRAPRAGWKARGCGEPTTWEGPWALGCLHGVPGGRGGAGLTLSPRSAR